MTDKNEVKRENNTFELWFPSNRKTEGGRLPRGRESVALHRGASALLRRRHGRRGDAAERLEIRGVLPAGLGVALSLTSGLSVAPGSECATFLAGHLRHKNRGQLSVAQRGRR